MRLRTHGEFIFVTKEGEMKTGKVCGIMKQHKHAIICSDYGMKYKNCQT